MSLNTFRAFSLIVIRRNGSTLEIIKPNVEDLNLPRNLIYFYSENLIPDTSIHT